MVIGLFHNSEKGIGLIFVLLTLLLLTLLGLAFAVQSNVEYRASENYVSHQEALAIADAGLNLVKPIIQRTDFNAILAMNAQAPAYVGADQPTAGSDNSRNAISMRAARNVDFNSPPSPATTYTVSGLLTPVTGQIYANGRYFAKVSNNTFGGSGSVFGKDTDPKVDKDSTLLVRVTGIRPTLANEKTGASSGVRNSVAVVEAMFKRNTAFDLGSPLTVNAPSASATFDGKTYDLDGYNHNGMTRAQIIGPHTENSDGAGPGIAVINDNPSGGDASSVASALYNTLAGQCQSENQDDPHHHDEGHHHDTEHLHQHCDNVKGAPGVNGDNSPSVGDITNALRTSDNPDSRKVLDPEFVGKFVDALKIYADTNYSTSQYLSGTGIQLGTDDNPKITYVDGDLQLNGNGSGAGILVVRGTLEVGGSFTYDGIVLVVGTGSVNFHGTNESFIGGVYVQKLTKNSDGHYVPGSATLTFKGNSDFYFSSDMVKMGLQLLPIQMTEWREITPEISP